VVGQDCHSYSGCGLRSESGFDNRMVERGSHQLKFSTVKVSLFVLEYVEFLMHKLAGIPRVASRILACFQVRTEVLYQCGVNHLRGSSGRQRTSISIELARFPTIRCFGSTANFQHLGPFANFWFRRGCSMLPTLFEKPAQPTFHSRGL
jgi:hypothetical protein